MPEVRPRGWERQMGRDPRVGSGVVPTLGRLSSVTPTPSARPQRADRLSVSRVLPQTGAGPTAMTSDGVDGLGLDQWTFHVSEAPGGAGLEWLWVAVIVLPGGLAGGLDPLATVGVLDVHVQSGTDGWRQSPVPMLYGASAVVEHGLWVDPTASPSVSVDVQAKTTAAVTAAPVVTVGFRREAMEG